MFVRTSIWSSIIIGVLAAGSAHAQAVSPQRAFLDRYCLTCHTQKAKERGAVPIALDTLDLANVPADAEVWEKVLRKMQAGLMPPQGAPRPDQTAAEILPSGWKTRLDRPPAPKPNPGRPLLHRLNRTEYANAI